VFQRAEAGLLAGLWQLPEAEGHLSAAQAGECLAAWGAKPSGEWRSYERKHIFTHIEWRMRVYAVAVTMPLPDGWRWLDDAIPLPVAYRVCLPD
jgi:A/G-specific adenine glycosylase